MIYRERFTVEPAYYGWQWHYTDDVEVAHGIGKTEQACKDEIDEWIENGEEYMGIDDEPDYDAPSFRETCDNASDLDRSMRW